MAEEEIPLADEQPLEIVGSRDESMKIKRIGAAGEARKSDFKRPVNLNGAGATRVRLFTSKIAAASLSAMERQINEWLDADGIEVKQVAHQIGTMQDKVKEENLILLVWY